MATFNDSDTKVKVRDIMTSPVITSLEQDNIEHVAKLMSTKNIGGVIITDKENNPVGIITERDIVKRVTAKNLVPKEVKAKDVMSSPVVTVNPDVDINEVARKMSKLDIRRLAVMNKGKLEGIVASKDIVAVMPGIIEIIAEKARINSRNAQRRGSLLVGYCNRCGCWSDTLKDYDGNFLCEECVLDM